MKFFNNKRELITLSIATLFFVAVPVFCPITFLKMDDYLLLWLNSGTYTGSPTPYTICSGFLYGCFISMLYRISDALEWYILAQYFLMYMGFISILLLVLRSSLKKSVQYCILLAVATLQFYYELQPHFSTISVYLSMISALLLFFSKNKKAWITAFFLFFFAAQIRLMAALVPYMVMTPLFIIRNIKGLEFRTHFIHLSICFAIAALTWSVDKIAYSPSMWQEGKRWDYMRAYFIDNDYRYQMLESIATPDDRERFELLASYRMIDPVIMDFGKLQEYMTTTNKMALSHYTDSLKSYIGAFRGQGATYVFPFVFIILVLLLFKFKDTKSFWTMMASIFLCTAGTFYMMLRSDAKGRYLFPMVILLLVIAIYFLYLHKPKYATIATVLFALLFGYRYGNELYPRIEYNHERLNETEIVELIDSYHDTDRVFQIHGAYTFPDAFHSNGHTWGCRVYQFGMLIVNPFFGPDKTCLAPVAKGTPILCLKDDDRIVELLEHAMQRDYHKETDVMILASSDNYKIVQIVPIQ